MRSIIFANYLARDTMRLGPTLGVENSHVRFLGSLVLNLWGQSDQQEMTVIRTKIDVQISSVHSNYPTQCRSFVNSLFDANPTSTRS